MSRSGAFIQCSMLLWLLPYECLPLSLWLSVWGSVWPLFASVCAHRWYSWSSCHYHMIYVSSLRSNGLIVISCLCDCVWGSLWPLLALTCAHWGSSWSSWITRWYTIRNWGWRSWVQAGLLSNGSCFYGCCHMSVYISDEINDMQWLTWSNLLMVVSTSFASQRKVSVQELSWHLHQNKFSCF